VKSLAMQWLKRVGATIGIVAALAGGWAGYLRLSGNFHSVEGGVLYRSAQLSGAAFADHIKDSGIRSILNLRGDNKGQRWYDDEMQASAAAGIQHVDLALSAGRELTDAQLRQVSDLLRDLPRPILIHCEGGADRSGLVAAMYQLLIANKSPEEAAGQLSFRYGHFPWLGSRTMAMDRTFERLVAQLPK
jgi:protein tyrosine/serine phosphatase